MNISNHGWLPIVAIGLVLSVTAAFPPGARAQGEANKIFKVSEPAPADRFAAVQEDHTQAQLRNQMTPEYMRAAGLFLDRCSSCHGEHGWGDGPWHTEFQPEPANLTLINDSEEMLRSIVLTGIPNTMMPAFPDLDNQTIDAIFNFVALQPRDMSNQWDYPWLLAKEIGAAFEKPDLKAGRQQFVMSCAGCHGIEGRGDGIMTKDPNIWPRPADFQGRNSDIGRLYYLISNGRKGTFMPPQEDKIPQLGRWRVAQYVQSLYNIKDTAKMRHPSGDIPAIRNPYLRADQATAEKGKDRYALWCAPCHASGGRGSLLAPRLIDRQWKYASGTDAAVWTIIREGVPGKLMISFDTLPEDERWQIITFLRFSGGLPDPAATQFKTTGQGGQGK